MEAQVYPRGRGIKINGASRGTMHSKNKQWIAGQGTVNPQSREGSSQGSDGERWERGGAPRRGRGRGRGSSRASPRSLTPAHHEEATSGAEEEDQDVIDVDGVEEEDMDADVEDKDPDNPEEREKFYQELVRAREVERKRAIAEGKMDDPSVPKRLEDAITMVGTCTDMCPRFERYRRERENNLDRWEVIPGTKRVDHRRAVKIYERAAGDKVIPSDLRPPEVLKKTLDYLFHDLIQRGGFAETHDFVRDRSRSVRNDFTIQHDTGPLAIECHARCARFHILALHLLRDKLSTQMELQQLMFTLQSLKEFFQDQRGRYSSPSELEMRVYHRLIHVRDQKERHDDIPEEISSHPVFTLTTKFRQCVQRKSAPITKTSTLKVDAEGMQIFGELASVLREQNDVVMIYLVACIIEVLFGYGTVEGIEELRGDLTIPEIIDGVSRPLKKGEELVKGASPMAVSNEPPLTFEAPSAPSSVPTNTIFRQALGQQAPSTNAVPPATQPAHSAFSNLAAKPNPFGGARSVFGGPVFGVAAPSTVFGTAPKSAFGPSAQPLSQAPLPASPPFAPLPAVPLSQPAAGTAKPIGAGVSPTTLPSQAPPPSGLFGTFGENKGIFAPLPSFSGAETLLAPHAASLNPKAPTFTPSSTLPVLSIPPSAIGTSPAVPTESPTTNIPPPAEPPSTVTFFPSTVPPPFFNTNIFDTNVSVPFSSASVPPPPLPQAQTSSALPGCVVERSETLWDFPGLPSHDQEASAKGFVTPITTSPIAPPPLDKVQPISLPPTPTARWFDPASYPKKTDSSLSLRKQSLLSLQMPEQPSPSEILSPLALPSPRILKSPPRQEESPTPKARYTTEPVASSSRISAPELRPVPEARHAPETPLTLRIPSPKGKGKEISVDSDVLIKGFLRRSYVTKKYFRIWQKKTADRAAYAAACRRSDAYKEKIQRERLSSSLSALPTRRPEDLKQKRRESALGVSPVKKRTRARVSSEYRSPLTDEQLAIRLKENHEEHERRWTRGSFLKTIRTRVVTNAPDNVYPSQWRVWLSMNMENDGTAIWLEHKFDVPESGEWGSEKVFSIPIVPKTRKPPSPGSPGLIVFERTPLEGFEDIIEKKYRILDDCSRLRDVVEDFRSLPKLRFTPVLLTITWADGSGSDTTPDFDEMVKKLTDEGTIRAAYNLVISSTATNLDEKFDDAIARLPLDFEDKSTVTISWKALSESFVAPFRNYASDWLDSCWINEGETLDWSRYGEVVRSLEEVQTALVRELLGVLGVAYSARAELSVDLHERAHLDETYATGLFLEAVLDTTVRHAKEALGPMLRASYVLPRDRLHAARARFDGALQGVAERLRLLAAASLSSRSAQKRRAEDGDGDGDGDDASGSPSSPKRRKTSSASAEESVGGYEAAPSDVLDVPPLSTTPSVATVSEAARPQVTVAMLRALAQGILQSRR